ncbi:hypothetical protein QY077_05705 [Klebsiella oxytoca]|jgi:hypothetical protein|uniref:hypothetical protein n=1 Tax=Enterobacterales TaxID=91347 RepID=UPI0007CD3376|nr:hypothetical protein [Klebsiella oxytoca]DAK71053.1 MAG TPA: hypothetical protein [Caudoviricetes sp.]ELK0754841.1 hypothetical protein [Klebsiella oxytoca]MBZ7251321.1 hypothetical protein [Klebsiella oxytoca]WKV99811.1 hypothetical protein Q3F89_16840 [Klebsiella oxytoca]WMH91667.1 hypothetical protein QY077_05705 [Klebsiella oxytoca]
MFSNYDPNQPMKPTGSIRTYSQVAFRVFLLGADEEDLTRRCKSVGWPVERTKFKNHECLAVSFSEYFPAEQEKNFAQLGFKMFCKEMDYPRKDSRGFDDVNVEFTLTGRQSTSIE